MVVQPFVFIVTINSIKSNPCFGYDDSLVYSNCFFISITSNQGNSESHFYKAVIFFFFFFLHLALGLKTYLISGRKSEHDVQCGCSQVGQSGGDFVGVSLSPCPHLRTPDLICGGAQAAPPLLPHQPPDRMGVSNED